MVLVALALAAPVPLAFAEEPVRPEPAPRELWRQFPLDTEPSNQQAPAERRSAPPSTSRSTGEEGRDRSLPTVQIAAIMLATALLFMLMTGALVYVTRGQFELTTDGLGRRRRRFREFVDGVHAALIGGRQYAVATRARRRSRRESPANELATLTETLDAYLTSVKGESTTDGALERLKAKLDHPAATSSPADDELAILQAKRGKPGSAGVERPDEVETLKAKLAGNGAAREGERTTRDALKAKSVQRAAPPKTLPREAVGVAPLKAKLDGGDEAENDEEAASSARANTGSHR